MTDYFKNFEFEAYTYRSNKILFAITFVIILVIGFIALNYSKFSGENYYYSECPSSNNTGAKCFNAYYHSNLCTDKNPSLASSDLCNQEFISAGHHLGNQAPFLVANFTAIGISIVVLAILLNTLLFNKGFFTYLKSTVLQIEG